LWVEAGGAGVGADGGWSFAVNKNGFAKLGGLQGRMAFGLGGGVAVGLKTAVHSEQHAWTMLERLSKWRQMQS
jgi:hypothetical protein